MHGHYYYKVILLGFLSCFGLNSLFAQNNASISGIVKEESSGKVLAFASVKIENTRKGGNTDAYGNFRLFNVPTGSQVLIINYLGYEEKRLTVELKAGQKLELEILMKEQLFSTEEVVISTQVQGQQAAINRQIQSNTIVNVVSKEKIEELPDQNAAETVGRLAGIAVQRDAGEGTKVVVRGLSPRFNSITVNGERIPSTDAEDRSVDLSMISTDALEGIEVFKALRPDMDGDAVGGTVNFTIKKAPNEFRATGKMQLGYNDQASELGQYRGSLSVSDRFMRGKMGLIMTGNVQRANRSSDVLQANYSQSGENPDGSARVIVANLNLIDRDEIRYRYGGSLTLDYQLKNGSILLSSFLGGLERNETRWRRRYRVAASYQEIDTRYREINTLLSSNTLSGEHNFKFLNAQLSWRASYGLTNRNTPYLRSARFRELGAFTADLEEARGPEFIPLGAKSNLDNTWFKDAFADTDQIDDRNLTSQIDLRIPLQGGDLLKGYFKVGAKYRQNDRSRDLTRRWTAFGGINDIIDDFPARFELDAEDRIKISNFISGETEPDFLNGQYDLGVKLDTEALNEFSETYFDYYVLDNTFDLQDYEAGEKIRAAYSMFELNFGEKLMILPGIRFEETQNNYRSVFGTPIVNPDGTSPAGLLGLVDTVGNRSYTEWLPMLHLRYKFTDWFDMRLAATKSLARPNYFNLVPWQNINYNESTLSKGNPDLRHTQVWNYDAFFSFYNKFGLFTVGTFYKELEDIDYIRVSRNLEAGQFRGFEITRPVNGESKATVRGLEIDLQTNLRFLPHPFNGILLGANYTYVQSETFFPLFEIGPRSTEPPFQPTIIDTTRQNRFPGQADHIVNVSMGYEKGGFSGRVSMVYQGITLGTIGTRAELDGYTDQFIRWDLIVKQKLGDSGFTIILNANNLSNTPERTFLGSNTFLTEEQFFGWTGDIGIQYNFDAGRPRK